MADNKPMNHFQPGTVRVRTIETNEVKGPWWLQLLRWLGLRPRVWQVEYKFEWSHDEWPDVEEVFRRTT